MAWQARQSPCTLTLVNATAAAPRCIEVRRIKRVSIEDEPMRRPSLAHPRRAIDCRHAASTAGRISVGHWAWHDTRTTESSTPTTTHDRHTRHVVSSSVSSQRGPCRISLALMISSNQPHNLLITNSVSARPTSSSSSSHDIFRVPKQQRHHEDHYSQRKYEQCCNSSGISMSSNDAGRLTGTERRWHHLVSCSRP